MDIGILALSSVLMAILMFMSIISKRDRKSKFRKALVVSILFGFISFGVMYFISNMLMQIPKIIYHK